VVPLASVLMPHGLPEIPRGVEATMGFFRTVKRAWAALYEKHQCQPPGDGGSHVSISRDVWNHRAEILARLRMDNLPRQGSVQMLAGGTDAQHRVQHALLLAGDVGDLPQLVGMAFHHDHFRAEVFIQMHVRGCEHRLVVMVL